MEKLILTPKAAMCLAPHPMQCGTSSRRLDEYIFVSPVTGEQFAYDGHWNTRFVGNATEQTVEFLKSRLGKDYEHMVQEIIA